MYVLKLLLQFQPAHPPWLLSPLTMKPAYKPNADLGLSAWQIILFRPPTPACSVEIIGYFLIV